MTQSWYPGQAEIEMEKSDKIKKVLFLVRKSKRGYIVEAVGSDDPQPCVDAEGIGNVIMEVIDDPDQPSVEEAPQRAISGASPEADAPKKSKPGKKVVAKTQVEEEDDEDEVQGAAGGIGDHAPGWDASDEILLNLFGSGVAKMREFSKWKRP